LIASLIGLCAAAVADMRNRVIPNNIFVFVAGTGLALRISSGLITSILSSLIGAALVFVVLAFLAHRNFIGGGDVKLITGTTFLVPPDRIAQLMLAIALAGGLLSCFYFARLVFMKNPRHPARRFMRQLFRRYPDRIKAHKPLPYALAILGGVTAYILSEVFQCFNATPCSL
jgi:prepilin peptidase CpaA